MNVQHLEDRLNSIEERLEKLSEVLDVLSKIHAQNVGANLANRKRSLRRCISAYQSLQSKARR